MKKRIENIDVSLLDADIDTYIYDAEGVIDGVMTDSFRVHPEKLIDGELDVWTTSTNLTNWAESGVAATRVITQEATEKHSGNYAAKIVATASVGLLDVGIYQDVAGLTAGDYEASVWCKFSARTAGYILLEAYNVTDGAVLASALVKTVCPWQELNVRFTLAGTKTVRVKCYLMDETTGTVYLDMASLKVFSSTNFDATHHSLIRSAATDLSAYYCISFNPGSHPTLFDAELIANMLFNSAERSLSFLSDPRVVTYLKSL